MSIPEKRSKILVVDDEEQIRRALRSILTSRGYDVELASSGEEAIDRVIDLSPDMIILDLSLPGIEGTEVCRELRTWFSAPILILSVRESEADKISALDCGADDYITKPFSAGELLARVRALLRRSSAKVTPLPVITVDDLEINIAQRKVYRGGQEISLRRMEFDILSYLAQNADCVMTSKMILEHVWGGDYTEDVQTLRVHVSNLRKKIEPHPSVPRYILTEPGVGFRFASS